MSSKIFFSIFPLSSKRRILIKQSNCTYFFEFTKYDQLGEYTKTVSLGDYVTPNVKPGCPKLTFLSQKLTILSKMLTFLRQLDFGRFSPFFQ